MTSPSSAHHAAPATDSIQAARSERRLDITLTSTHDRDYIRLRALVLGLILSIAICLVTPFNNVYRQATPLGGGHFPLAPFYLLIWLTIGLAFLRRLGAGGNWLTGKELLVVWIQMVLVSGIAYTGLARTFFINLTAPYHFATVANRWEEVLHPLIPGQWVPHSAEAVDTLYNGLAGGQDMSWMEVLRSVPWAAWVQPLVAWSVFILLSYLVMVCLVNLLTRQAIDNERMNFPLLQVPQMMEAAFDNRALGRFLGNRFMLAGLLIPVSLHLLNGLHFYYPSVPQLPTLILAGPYFPAHGLFSAFYKLKIYIYPAFIGFAFLTTKQISLSFWLFFILGGLLIGLLNLLGYNIPAAALGVTFGPTLAKPEETQMIGAYAVFFVFLFWLARRHLFNVLQQAFSLHAIRTKDREALFSILSCWGVLIGSLSIVLWMHAFGMGLWVAVVTLSTFFIFTLVASRIICQGGIAYFTLTAAPLDAVIFLFGPGFFSHVGLLIAGVAQKILFVDLRESLMPSLLHSRKITRQNTNRAILTAGIMVTIVAGLVVSFVAMLTLCYKYGVRELEFDWASRTTLAVYDNIQTLVESPVAPGNWVTIFAVAGAVVMLILVICYQRFYWWPIHPIGYLTTYSSAMRILWFSFFLGWLCNTLCMRYGGVALFKRLRFFFIGLIIGDFLMGGSWALFGLFQDASYQVLPN